MATTKELQKKSDKDLMKMLVQKREEVRAFRFGAAGSQLRDVSGARKSKREIAQVLTELTLRNRSTT